MIPEKYKNTCPLDHSTYEKYIECNCNFGSANEVWYFKEQELAKLKAENEKLKAELFNQKEHYEVLKENYDNVFIFMAEKTDRTISECFDRYKDWLAK